MPMQPTIELLKTTLLLGQKRKMSFTENKTVELWQSFAPRIKEIQNAASPLLYSVEVYPSTDFYQNFDPDREFEKWAAVEVLNEENIPEGMEILSVPVGLYTRFPYRGKASEAEGLFHYIFGEWLPGSEYEMDSRPFLAVMGPNYKGEDSESEEDFFVPVRRK